MSDDGASTTDSQTILDRYLKATEAQQDKLRGITMDVAIDAELPKMKKRGTLHALRTISRLGKITYDALKFEGDNSVKKDVIARYLSAEVEASDKKAAPPITPEFYKFKYKGLVQRDSQEVHLFQVSPKKKRPGTFKGELWLDQATCLPIRESGTLSKNPSVFIKRFEFIRDYEIRDGVAVPKTTHGKVLTRLWGSAEMRVDFSNVTPIPEPLPSPLQIVLLEELFQLPKMP